MNNHKIMPVFLSSLLISLPCFASKDRIEKSSTTSTSQLIVDQVNFNTPIDQLLKKWELNLQNNTNPYTNLNLDYEEFILDPQIPLSFHTVNLNHHYQDFSIFYDKKSKNIFSFELLINDSNAIKKIIYSFSQMYGKPLFHKEQSSKEGTIFFDENGNEISQQNQIFYHWKHDQYSYYLIEKKAKKHSLNIIVINNQSPRFQTWFTYKSLNMIFP